MLYLLTIPCKLLSYKLLLGFHISLSVSVALCKAVGTGTRYKQFSTASTRSSRRKLHIRLTPADSSYYESETLAYGPQRSGGRAMPVADSIAFIHTAYIQ